MKELIQDIIQTVDGLQEKKNLLFMMFLEQAKREYLEDDDYECFSTFIEDHDYQEVYKALDKISEDMENVFTEKRYLDFQELADEEKQELKMSKTERELKHIFKDRKLTSEEISALIDYIEEQKNLY